MNLQQNLLFRTNNFAWWDPVRPVNTTLCPCMASTSSFSWTSSGAAWRKSTGGFCWVQQMFLGGRALDARRTIGWNHFDDVMIVVWMCILCILKYIAMTGRAVHFQPIGPIPMGKTVGSIPKVLLSPWLCSHKIIGPKACILYTCTI